MTWAVVPLKSPDAAKTRLSPVLSPEQRRALFFELADRVLRALAATPGIERVAVVTASDDVDGFASKRGAQVIRQAGDAGTAAAFAAALRQLHPLQLERVLMIAGDLPLITPAAIEAVLAAGTGIGVVIVPDRQHIGTNALLCTPPQVIVPQFGADSLRRHLAAAQRLDLRPRVLEIEALALDLDTPSDLAQLPSSTPLLTPRPRCATAACPA